MVVMVHWLLLAGFIVAAWFISKRHREAAGKIGRLLPVAAGIVLLSSAITGWLRADGVLTNIHRWTGHALVVIIWLGVPFAIGVLLQQHVRCRSTTAVCQLFAFLVVLGSVSLAGFTGYLGPSHLDSIGEETRNRFNILHPFFLPGLIFALLFEWWWFFSPEEHNPEPGT
jgi:hypothetical protein